jgi:hypothetical protein
MVKSVDIVDVSVMKMNITCISLDEVMLGSSNMFTMRQNASFGKTRVRHLTACSSRIFVPNNVV